MKRVTSLIIVGIFWASVLFAQSEYIPSPRYFETTLAEIQTAKFSIHVYMYLISVSPDEPQSQVKQLLEALVKAKERGVDVKVILDQNIDFSEEIRDAQLSSPRNQYAFEYLKTHNISVFFDEADTSTHIKAVIIDNETVIMGSANWTKTALSRNREASVLIRSKELAQDLLKDIGEVKHQEVPAIFSPGIPLPKDFLTDKKLLGEMVSQSDERAFDTYLYLLSQHDQNEEGSVTLNYDKLARSLGIDHMTKEDYRRQINKVSEKLEEKYKLISFKHPDRNQDVQIILKDPQNPRNSYTTPKERFFLIPTTYWRYGWNKTLSFSAKVMYLVSLSYSSDESPSWFMSREALSNKHNISESFISEGTRELKKLNLLDIQHGELESGQYDQRSANVYTPKHLYNPKELEKRLKDLESEHGKEKLDRAKQAAAIVFEESNFKTIKTLINLEDLYGQFTVQEAAKKISEKNPDNPKRSAGYLINTIKNMGKGAVKVNA